ncbi:hypothetical protein [Pseudoalteromonas arabiensis]|uniref:hypothetical protein n=1 Tax=Pseudoalteromonas arabiensis TaxID=874454 RepID=UPI000781A337|nr:hypothetical protein [Pseudoalteromonas arabiensis]
MKIKNIIFLNILTFLILLPPKLMAAKNIAVEDTGFTSSFFCLNKAVRYSDGTSSGSSQLLNGVPKYCGATGTYTHKHIPVAVSKDGHRYEVFTDNTQNGNEYPEDRALRLYLVKDSGPKVLIHTEEKWHDPHMNASVDVDDNGYVWVHMSSRGLLHRFKSGFVFKSIAPHSFVMRRVAGGHEDPQNESYPQVHHTTFGKVVLFTRYEQFNNKNIRTIWVNKEGVMPYKLVDGGHYQVSWYDKKSATLFTAYNYHPDGSLDNRANIFVLKTTDGENWYNVKNEQVASLGNPLPTRSPKSLVYDSEFRGLTIYLKDIITDCDNNLRVLMTESMSHDPTKGLRQLSELIISPNGSAGVKTLHRTNHNYSAGAYLYEGCQLYTLSNGDNGKQYFGGDLILKKLTGGSYILEKEYKDGKNYSYIRRVRGDGMSAVASQGSIEIAPNDPNSPTLEGNRIIDSTSSSHVRISIK